MERCAGAEHPRHRWADPGCQQVWAAEARQGEHPLPFSCRTAQCFKRIWDKGTAHSPVQQLWGTTATLLQGTCVGVLKLSNFLNRHSLTLNLESISRSTDEQKTVRNSEQRVIATCTKRPSNLNHLARLCRFYQLSEQTCIVINYWESVTL